MADFVYAQNYQNLKSFFEKLQSVGIPDKATQDFLSSLGFIDASAVPTEAWRRYRNKAEGRKVLAGAIRSAYATLFATYPDAQRQDNEALRNFFSTHTKVGDAALGHMVKTFKILSEMADFEDAVTVGTAAGATSNGGPVVNGAPSMPTGSATPAVVFGRGGPAGLTTININIELQLPETENPAVYENFFAAMKKCLFP